jgi:protein arginine kinase activator
MDEGMGYFDSDDMGFEMANACDDCEVNPATVHLTHVEQGSSHTFHLCEECARRRGVPLPDGDTLLKGLQAILGGAVASALGEAQQTKAAAKQFPKTVKEAKPEVDTECGGCGTKLSDFRAKGRLGCAGCYGSFEAELEKTFLRLHESAGHKGKKYGEVAPYKGGKRGLSQLRRELDEAVREEDFERAAIIRDMIRGSKQGAK